MVASCWAIPKGLADFTLETEHRGPLSTTEWSASIGRRPVASASFRDVSRAAPRLPFKGGTWQPELPEGGGEKTAVLRGSSKSLPARAHWDFDRTAGSPSSVPARQLASFRMASVPDVVRLTVAEERPEPPEDHVLRWRPVAEARRTPSRRRRGPASRWRIRGQTFAHMMVPRAEHLEQMGGPRVLPDAADPLGRRGVRDAASPRPAYLVHPVQGNLVVMLLDDDTDWDKVA